MLLFATWDNATVIAVVGMIMVVIKLIEKVYDNRRSDKLATAAKENTIAAAATVAAKVNEVKTSAAASAVEIKGALKLADDKKTVHLEEQDKVLQAIAIHVNGLNEQIKEAGRAEGVLQQKDKESSKPDGTGETHSG